MARLSLALLGSLHITLDGEPVTDFTYNKARALLAYLAVESDRAHHRDALVGLLWPNMPDQSARTNLRQALAKLREAIGDAEAAPPFLLITRDTVQFNLESAFELDVTAFTAILSACQSHSHRGPDRCRSCAERMEKAIALYRGEFLEQFSLADSASFEEWAVLKREHFHQSALTMLTALATFYERRGGIEQGQKYASRQIEMDPWREEAYQQSMRLLARMGQRSLALEQYEACKRRLSEGLGVAPAHETTKLYEHIRDGLELGAVIESQNRLPAPPNALIGRERELATLSELLANPHYRLITITGPGGIGKTRLALEAVHNEASGFTHGAAWIDLAPVSAPDLIASAILSGLDVSLASQQEPAEQLLAHLREKEMLLAIDNFEHLLAGASLLGEIVQHAPGISLLVTSRERLGLRAEQLVELDGLDYPDVKNTQRLESYSAVQLFAQRAKAVRADFAIHQDNAPSIAEICTRLDGMPLAIELAAARSRLMNPPMMLEKLSSRLNTLTSGSRDLPTRQQTLRSALDWSYNLLDANEKTLFARLSVFRGGASQAAIEAVCGPGLEMNVLEGLESLLNKSLLRQKDDRFGMLDTIHEYARERLNESGEAENIRRQHAEFFLEWLGQMRTIFAQYELEHGNLQLTLEWSLGGGDNELGLRLLGAMYDFWLRQSRWREWVRWIAPASQHLGEVSEATRAGALAAFGALSYYGNGDIKTSKQYGQDALAIYRRLGDNRKIGRTIVSLGSYAAGIQEEYTETVTLIEEAIALLRAEGDLSEVARGLNLLGVHAYSGGDRTRARAAFEQCIDLSRKIGQSGREHLNMANLAGMEQEDGNFVQAAALYRKSLLWFIEMKWTAWIISVIGSLVSFLTLRGQPEHAARLVGALEVISANAGTRQQPTDQAEYDRDLARLLAQLGEEKFNAVKAEGRFMTIDETIEFALEQLQP